MVSFQACCEDQSLASMCQPHFHAGLAVLKILRPFQPFLWEKHKDLPWFCLDIMEMDRTSKVQEKPWLDSKTSMSQ